MMVVYNPMDAKERTTVRNAGFYAEFDESNSETSESEHMPKKQTIDDDKSGSDQHMAKKQKIEEVFLFRKKNQNRREKHFFIFCFFSRHPPPKKRGGFVSFLFLLLSSIEHAISSLISNRNQRHFACGEPREKPQIERSNRS